MSLIVDGFVGIPYQSLSNAQRKRTKICCLCKNLFEKSNAVHVLACKHILHSDCFNQQIRARTLSKDEITCPVKCKEKVAFNVTSIAKILDDSQIYRHKRYFIRNKELTLPDTRGLTENQKFALSFSEFVRKTDAYRKLLRITLRVSLVFIAWAAFSLLLQKR